MPRWVSFVAIAFLFAAPARAASVASFYGGRTVTVVVGYSAGGGYDSYARLLARYMGKHIPGNPTLVPQNMPGAGSLKAANYLYAVAPKDGSVFGTFARGMAMEPLLGNGTEFDAAKFAWLGSAANEVSICASWIDAPVKDWNDLLSKEFVVGGEGSGSDPDIFSTILRTVFGAKIKLVTGYPGSSEISLAIERGELQGRCGWSWGSIKTQKSDWLAAKKLNLIVQLALKKSPDLPDVPLVMDEATTDRQRQILKLVLSRQAMARPFAAPPGIPAERKDALRAAFDATLRDPEFRADAERQGLEIAAVSGAEIDQLVGELYQTPKDVIAETRAAIADAR